mmetsp:Transcript_105215/g.250471  ORF Transcript_105215/g.250471 Transcript_105215/m.250471 type:complete len:818 (+) Transcript_105215:71-2524(+)
MAAVLAPAVAQEGRVHAPPLSMGCRPHELSQNRSSRSSAGLLVAASAVAAAVEGSTRRRIIMKQTCAGYEARSAALPRLRLHVDRRAGEKNTTIVTNMQEADRVLKILRQHEDQYHAIDTEVRGWTPEVTPYGHGEVVCFSIFVGPNVDFGSGAQLLVDNMDEDGNLRGLVEHFREYFEDPGIKKVFQNYAFDRAILLNHGCRVAGFHADTMHMARLINSDAESVSLQALGETHLSGMWKKQDFKLLLKKVGATSTEEIHKSQDPTVRKEWVDYAAFDAQVTWKLHQKFHQLLSMDVNRVTGQGGTLLDFYEKFWRPFAEVLVDIEERGVYLDQNFLKQQMKVAEKDREKALTAFKSFLRDQWSRRYPDHPELMENVERFNNASPKQMKQLLYGTGVKAVGKNLVGGFGLLPVKVGKSLESTGQEAFAILAGPAPEEGRCGTAEKIVGQEGCVGLNYHVEMAFVNKAVSTFLSKLTQPDIVDERGRLHTSLSFFCRTGRLTSRNPNLQQIPAVDKDRYQIRNSIIPESGKVFIVADYGQLDLRVLAHTSGCPDLIGALKSGIDLHSHTAAQMYPHIQDAIDKGEVSLEGDYSQRLVKDVYPSERRSAKAVNFGIAYGLTSYGLAKQLSCQEREAQDMIDKWYEAYPKVKQWQSEVIEEAERSVVRVHTYRGRPRHILGLLKRPRVGHELVRRQVPEIGRPQFANSKRQLYSKDKSFWEYLSAKRQAINAPVQGGSADVVAEAMVKAAGDEVLKELGYHMVLQVHDELLFEGPEESAEEALEAVRRVMEDPFLDDYQFLVPLVVDAKIATSWHEAKHA